ncbi:hypothetical protein pb186bvf_018991 [Paramecium bursaria]
MQMQVKFSKVEEDEQKSLKQKKELIKQEFEHQEEIKKQDSKLIGPSNDYKFKNELDKIQILNKSKYQQLLQLQQPQSQGKFNTSLSQMHSSQSTFGCIRSINNHHSDPLFETVSRNLLCKSPEEMAEYKRQLEEEESRYDNLILEEQERSESLKSILSEIEKSKLILQQKVEELQLLQKVAEKRFANTETLFFLANEKNALSRKNLKLIKGELNEMQEIRGAYKKTQQDKQSDLQKVIYVGEENIGHNFLKIEEAQSKNKELLDEIEKLEIQEQNILVKTQESRFIINYMECFEQFELIFMNKLDNNETRIVDKYEVDENLIKQYQKSTVHFESNESINNLSFDRNRLVMQINKFYSKGESRTKIIMDFMLEKYWHLQQELSQSSMHYENLIKQKNLLSDENLILHEQIQALKSKNPNLEIHQQSLVAEDAGLLVDIGDDKKTTTYNIKVMEVDEQSDQVLMNKANKAQGLLMKFQLSLAEFIQRIYKTIKQVEEKNKDIKKFKYQGLEGELDRYEAFLQYIYHNQQSKKNPGTPNDHGDHHNPHISLYTITKIFQDVFQDDSQSQYFYIQCKTDQILWFHLTPENIKSFLENIKREKSQQNIGTDTINNFRESLVEIFLANFRELLTFYKNIYIKLRDHITDLQVHLKENNPKFDPQKLSKIIPREGHEIKQSKEQIIERLEEYNGTKEERMDKKQKLREKANKKDEELKNFLKEKTMENKDKKDKRPRTEDGKKPQILQSFLVKAIQPELNIQSEILMLENNQYTETDLNQIRSFFRGKLHQKNEPVIFKKQIQKQEIQKPIEKDELEREREQMKAQIMSDIQKIQEEKEKKDKPENKETLNERKLQIKEATERLYGERGANVSMLRQFAVSTNILSDIDRLENQVSKIEQPQIVGQYIMQKRNMNRNLNKDLTLPTLSYLKPTSAYFSRRNQSSEQIKALDYKRYYEIEHGVTSRPATQQIQRKQIQKTTFNTDQYKQRYGQRQLEGPKVVTDFPTQEGPKSILVPIQ